MHCLRTLRNASGGLTVNDSSFRCFACMQPIDTADAVCPHCGHDNHVRDNGPGYLPETVLQNQYLVGRMLGRGGFGVTYFGYDLALERVVAIKEYFPRELALRDSQSISLSAYSDHVADFTSGCERALRESRLAAGLGYIPCIVHVYNALMTNNTVYIIMEYIDGETLTAYVSRNGGKLSLQRTVELLQPIADALATLHARNVIHRDVKPDNIMIRRDSEKAVLLDFGAARVLDTRTMSLSSLIYSPGYAPPEQCSAITVADAKVDQYAFCATLYYALTGQIPMDCQLRLYTSRDMPAIHTFNDSVSPEAEAVIVRGMAVKAEDRYAGMAELMAALTAAMSGRRPAPAVPAPAAEAKTEPVKKSGKGKIIAIAVSAAVLAGAGFYAVNAFQGNRLLPDPQATAVVEETAAPVIAVVETDTPTPTTALKETSAEFFQTEERQDGTLSITGYTGSDTVIAIPSTIDGKAVTVIGRDAFQGCKSIEQVVIPDSVTTIDCYAFHSCPSLMQVRIPDSVTSINGRAFFYCSSLASIRLPMNLGELSDNPFFKCTSLTEIIIPEGLPLTFIDGLLIQNNNTLISCLAHTSKTVTIPNSVTAIGANAFALCDSLEQIDIPDSVTLIDQNAFQNCSSLVQVHIPQSVTSISSGMFFGCTSLAQVQIPASVTTIDHDAFKNCTSLDQVTIPASVSSIGEDAFENCSPDLVLYVEPGSFAEKWAQENSIKYQSEGIAPPTIAESFETEQLEDGTLAITKYTGSDTVVAIPSSIGGKAVTVIGEKAFEECKSIEQVIIPDSVTVIGDSAFAWCGFVQLQIPDSVTTIGSNAFGGCESLKEIQLPDSLNAINNSTFSWCHSLEQIRIPDSVTSIGDYAFSECESLIEVQIPNSVTTIGIHAFWCCKSLNEVQIPDSVISIGDYAFENCISLERLQIPDSVVSIGERAFALCEKLTEVHIPASVISISDEAFAYCSPDLVLYVEPGSYAEIWVQSNGFKYQVEGVVTSAKNFSTEELEDGTLAITDHIGSDEVVVIPSVIDGKTVTAIDKYSFDYDESMQQVIIPDTVVSIGNGAFSPCYALEQVQIPDSVTVIGESAFGGCKSLKQVQIPDSVTVINDAVFRECTNLEQVQLPAYLTSIGEWAFYGCSSLEQVQIPDSVEFIGESAFQDCIKLSEVQIPDSVTVIGKSAFWGCKSLKQVQIPDSVTVINDAVFRECTNLEQVQLPAYLTSIGEWAFYGCSSLEQVQLPAYLTSIGKYAFSDCSSLEQVQIPDSVKSIGEYAFFGCTNLTKVQIPASVTSIDDAAFSNSSKYSSPDLVLYVEPGSYAEKWAQKKSIPYRNN